jgi:steroid 5-alpha reductase family enzyme
MVSWKWIFNRNENKSLSLVDITYPILNVFVVLGISESFSNSTLISLTVVWDLKLSYIQINNINKQELFSNRNIQ